MSARLLIIPSSLKCEIGVQLKPDSSSDAPPAELARADDRDTPSKVALVNRMLGDRLGDRLGGGLGGDAPRGHAARVRPALLRAAHVAQRMDRLGSETER